MVRIFLSSTRISPTSFHFHDPADTTPGHVQRPPTTHLSNIFVPLIHGAARRLGIAMPSPSTYTNGESFSLLPMWGGSAVEGAIALLFVDFNMRSAHTHLVNLATETVISELAPSIPNRRSDVVDLCSASHMNNDGFIHASSQYRLLRHNRNTDSLMASLIFRLYECIRGHGADICRYCGDTSPSLTRCSSCRGLSCPTCTLCRPDTGSCPSPSDSTQSCGSCGSNCGHATAAECQRALSPLSAISAQSMNVATQCLCPTNCGHATACLLYTSPSPRD